MVQWNPTSSDCSPQQTSVRATWTHQAKTPNSREMLGMLFCVLWMRTALQGSKLLAQTIREIKETDYLKLVDKFLLYMFRKLWLKSLGEFWIWLTIQD